MKPFALFMVIALWPGSAAAQSAGDHVPKETDQQETGAPQRIEREPVAPGPNPQQRGEAQSPEAYAKLVDALYVKLREAKSEAEAETIDDALTALWARRGGATAQTLLEWSQEEVARKRYATALDYLDALLVINPDHFEAYFRRAVIAYQMRAIGQAINDLGRTLALEPRHYAALGVLGHILAEIGREKEALAAFQSALALIPLRGQLKKQVERLSPQVEGRPG